MDFLHDSLEVRRNFRLLNVIDGCFGQKLGTEVDCSKRSEHVIRSLRRIICWRGKPLVIFYVDF